MMKDYRSEIDPKIEHDIDDSNYVRRINLGYRGEHFDKCIDSGIITYRCPVRAYEMHRSGDRDGLLNYYMSLKSSWTGEFITKEVASRYINEFAFFYESGEEVLWITQGRGELYWCRAKSGAEIIDDYIEDNPNTEKSRRYFMTSRRTINGWSNKSLNGGELKLWALHPKAKDWLTQRGTIGAMHDGHDRYFIALINGDDLSEWHGRPEMKRAAERHGWHPRPTVPSVPTDWGFEVGRMASGIMNRVRNGNGQQVLRTVKIKETTLDEASLHILLRKLLLEQNYKCKITGRALVIGDHWLKPSPDRIDSNRGYLPGNIQITTWAANMAKQSTPPQDVESLFSALQFCYKEDDVNY